MGLRKHEIRNYGNEKVGEQEVTELKQEGEIVFRMVTAQP